MCVCVRVRACVYVYIYLCVCSGWHEGFRGCYVGFTLGLGLTFIEGLGVGFGCS